jgi:hypothetical protein
MALGPIEVLVVAFPGNEFNGQIIPELERLVESNTIALIDGLFIRKDADGEVTFVEFEEEGGGAEAMQLVELMNQLDSLISDEDVMEIADGLEPDSSAAMLVFENTWAKPFADAIVDSNGVMVTNFRVPRAAVDEVLAALAEIDD